MLLASERLRSNQINENPVKTENPERKRDTKRNNPINVNLKSARDNKGTIG